MRAELEEELDLIALNLNLIGTRLVRKVEGLRQVHGLHLSTVLEGVGVVVDELATLKNNGNVSLIARGHRGEEEVALSLFRLDLDLVGRTAAGKSELSDCTSRRSGASSSSSGRSGGRGGSWSRRVLWRRSRLRRVRSLRRLSCRGTGAALGSNDDAKVRLASQLGVAKSGSERLVAVDEVVALRGRVAQAERALAGGTSDVLADGSEAEGVARALSGLGHAVNDVLNAEIGH